MTSFLKIENCLSDLVELSQPHCGSPVPTSMINMPRVGTKDKHSSLAMGALILNKPQLSRTANVAAALFVPCSVAKHHQQAK